MRLRAILFAALAFGAVGWAAHRLAAGATAHIERDSAARVIAAMRAGGLDWIEVTADGLMLTLTGIAPDEPTRFRAVETARRIVAGPRVTDVTTVRAPAPSEPPSFALEILRNESEVSLIGLVPGAGGRADIRAALEGAGLAGSVVDMLETADHPAPDDWGDAVGLAIVVTEELPRARISVEPGRVEVVAVAETAAARDALEERLAAAAPEGIELALDIAAPRPVIAPFEIDITLADGAGRLAACSAGTEDDAGSILAAARAAGVSGDPDCAIGLGAPSPDWAPAVASGIDALRELGGGRFAIRDLVAVLTGPDDVEPDRLAAVGERLDAALPAVFALTTIAPPRMEAREGGPPVYAPRFDAALGADGRLRLEGPMQDPASQEAVNGFAQALFGHDRVENTTVIDPALPDGWPLRVLSGLEALAEIKEGRLRVTPEAVEVEGSSLEPDAEARLAGMLADKIGGAVQVAVRFDAEAAAAAAAAERSRPEICAEEIGAILEDGSIQFAAGSTEIDPESRGVIAAIADVLRGCPGARFDIAGHTDSQGADEVNQRLSEERAQAVLAAIEAQAPPLIVLTARGFGAARPIADNETEDGRAANRRIEITLVAPGDQAAADASAEGLLGPQ